MPPQSSDTTRRDAATPAAGAGRYLPREGRAIAVGFPSDGAVPQLPDGLSLVGRLDEGVGIASPGSPYDVVITTPSAALRNLTAIRAALRDRGIVWIDLSGIPDRMALASALSEATVALSGESFAVLSPEPLRGAEAADAAPRELIARKDEYRVRGYEPGDESAILDLFELAFGVRRGTDHWTWQYANNPFGSHRISLATDPEGTIVAQYAGYPVPVWCTEGPYPGLANHVGDTMTRVAVRSVGRGHTSVLARTVRHFFAAHCDGRVAFNYGFNVANIQKLSTRFFGSFRVEPVTYRVRPAASPAPHRRSLLRRLVEGDYAARVVDAVPGEEWTALFARVAPSYRFLVRRDARYLAWRYLECPSIDYRLVEVRLRDKLVGWSVFRRKGDALVWGDALFDPAHAESAAWVLQAASELDIARDAVRVEAWFPPRPAWWNRELDTLGFRVAPEPNDLSVMCTPFEDSEVVERMRRELYYTACDSDLF